MALVPSIGIASHSLLNNDPIPEQAAAEDVVLPVSGPFHPMYVLLCSYLDYKVDDQPAKYPFLSEILEQYFSSVVQHYHQTIPSFWQDGYVHVGPSLAPEFHNGWPL